MSHIILARHGQASLLGRDYDKLCTNGEAQARLLGEYWSQRGVVLPAPILARVPGNRRRPGSSSMRIAAPDSFFPRQ